MTPTEQKAFDQMREAVERLQKRLVTKCQEQLVTFSFVDVDILNAAAEALTAANAVSHPKPETTPLPEGVAITSESTANAIHPQATEPAGYKLVPVEPTPEMLYAIQNDCDILPPRGKRIWAAMLAAAPEAKQ